MTNFVDAQSIMMTKQKEDDVYVWYKFEVNVDVEKHSVDEKRGRCYLYGKEPRYGVFRFRKEGSDDGIAFVIIKDQTDPLLQDHDRVTFGCLHAMFRCKCENDFRMYTSYQS